MEVGALWWVSLSVNCSCAPAGARHADEMTATEASDFNRNRIIWETPVDGIVDEIVWPSLRSRRFAAERMDGLWSARAGPITDDACNENASTSRRK